MPLSVKNYLRASVIAWIFLISCLIAQTNQIDDINLFYQETWAKAWDDMGKVYINSKGHLCIENEVVGTARLVMWSYFFAGHPFQNTYHDILLGKEIEVEDAKVNLHMCKEENKSFKKLMHKRMIVVAALVSIPLSIYGGRIGYKIAEKKYR